MVYDEFVETNNLIKRTTMLHPSHKLEKLAEIWQAVEEKANREELADAMRNFSKAFNDYYLSVVNEIPNQLGNIGLPENKQECICHQHPFVFCPVHRYS